MKRRVVITGIAPIAAIGIGKDEFFQNLFDKKIVIEEIPEEYTKNYKFTSKYRVPAPKIDLDKIELPFLYEKLLSQGAKYALAGSYFALKDAGFEIIKKDKKYEVEGIKEAKIILEQDFLEWERRSTVIKLIVLEKEDLINYRYR